MPQTAPYGTWTSPINADLIAKSSVSLDDVLVDPKKSDSLYVVEKRPNEGGRSVVVELKSSQAKDVFDDKWNARTGVEEYGGASAIVYDGVVYFSNYDDSRVYAVKESGSAPVPVTPDNTNFRYANFAVHPTASQLIVSILEDHTKPEPANVVTTLVTINVKDSSIHNLVSGADFYSSPTFSPDGKRIAWVQWNHPDMPWDGGEVHAAEVSVEDNAISITNELRLKGTWKEVSAVQPRWISNDTLLFLTDERGFKNPYVAKAVPGSGFRIEPVIKPFDEEFAEPEWYLGYSYIAALSETSVLFLAFRQGRSVIYLVDPTKQTKKEIPSPYAHIVNIRPINADTFILLGEATDSPRALVLGVLDGQGGATYKTIRGGDDDSAENIPKTYFSSPEPLTFSAQGKPLYTVFYPPTNPEFVGPANERPPCVVSIHGGPTSMTAQGLSLKVQYFTSRGFAWVDVNYGGSSGYGRDYIDRLKGQWGITDVTDSVNSVKELAGSDKVDPKRITITGGSAGGYTVLNSMCTVSDVFAAGTSSYGISNLFNLATGTHKFESRYLDGLLGGTPDEVPDVYKDRSPYFHADKIKSPLLILQGSIDPVVPPDQAKDMVEAIKKNGGQVEYHEFEGEGHGWRKAENIIKALEFELDFYLRMLKIKN